MEATISDAAFFSNNYMNVLLGMSDDTKLRIIRMLTDSLLKREEVIEKSSAFTSEMLKSMPVHGPVQNRLMRFYRLFVKIHPFENLCHFS